MTTRSACDPASRAGFSFSRVCLLKYRDVDPGHREHRLGGLHSREGPIAGKARTSHPRPFGWHANLMTAEPGGKAAVAGGCPALLVGGTVTGVVVIL
jgi:hypothetical protein